MLNKCFLHCVLLYRKINFSITIFPLTYFRQRAIIHPLRRKPGKLLSISVIAVIWTASLIFAIPMGMVYDFDYHEEYFQNGTELSYRLKPFCSVCVTNTTIITEKVFGYYR